MTDKSALLKWFEEAGRRNMRQAVEQEKRVSPRVTVGDFDLSRYLGPHLSQGVNDLATLSPDPNLRESFGPAWSVIDAPVMMSGAGALLSPVKPFRRMLQDLPQTRRMFGAATTGLATSPTQEEPQDYARGGLASLRHYEEGGETEGGGWGSFNDDPLTGGGTPADWGGSGGLEGFDSSLEGDVSKDDLSVPSRDEAALQAMHDQVFGTPGHFGSPDPGLGQQYFDMKDLVGLGDSRDVLGIGPSVAHAVSSAIGSTPVGSIFTNPDAKQVGATILGQITGLPLGMVMNYTEGKPLSGALDAPAPTPSSSLYTSSVPQFDENQPIRHLRRGGLASLGAR